MRKYKVIVKFIEGNTQIVETTKVWTKESAIAACKNAKQLGAVAAKYKFIGK